MNAKRLTRRTWGRATLTTTVIGSVVLMSACQPQGNGNATLDALRPALAAHAAALGEDGGPKSVTTGRKVIAIYEAGTQQ